MNKKELKKKAISTLLAGSLIFGTGVGLSQKANAYNLKEPTVSLEEYNNYDGVKIFINGRLVEFNDSLGYPYIDAEAGRTMIPLRAVAETFNATVSYEPNGRLIYVTRFNHYAKLRVDNNNIWYTDKFDPSEKKIPMDTKAIIKNDRTYIPLRALFECFGLNVRWDAENKIAHIETLNDNFDYVDFKDKNIIRIGDLDISKVNKVIYDEVEVKKDYVNILKYSDQYKVFVEDGVARIYSYQFLSTINYLYQKEKELIEKIPEDKNRIYLGFLQENEEQYFSRVSDMDVIDEMTTFNYSISSVGNDYYAVKHSGQNKEKYVLARAKAKEVAKDIMSKTLDKKEQIRMAHDYVCSICDYYIDDYEDNGYAYNVFYEGRSYCNGFESAFKMILDELSIPTTMYLVDVPDLQSGHRPSRCLSC